MNDSERKELASKACSKIRITLAIEMLEYEDRNLLSGDNETRSRMKQELLDQAMKTMIYLAR